MESAENLSNGRLPPPTASGSASAGGGGGGGEAESIGQRIDRAGGHAREAYRSTRASLLEIGDRLELQRRVQRNPYGMVAAALGVGYLLGGGVFSRFTARVVGLAVRIGIRAAAIPFVEREISGFVDAMTGGADGPAVGRRTRRERESQSSHEGRQP